MTSQKSEPSTGGQQPSDFHYLASLGQENLGQENILKEILYEALQGLDPEVAEFTQRFEQEMLSKLITNEMNQ